MCVWGGQVARVGLQHDTASSTGEGGSIGEADGWSMPRSRHAECLADSSIVFCCFKPAPVTAASPARPFAAVTKCLFAGHELN